MLIDRKYILFYDSIILFRKSMLYVIHFIGKKSRFEKYSSLHCALIHVSHFYVSTVLIAAAMNKLVANRHQLKISRLERGSLRVSSKRKKMQNS